jgi:flagellar L-ring protein precursor FlgH
MIRHSLRRSGALTCCAAALTFGGPLTLAAQATPPATPPAGTATAAPAAPATAAPATAATSTTATSTTAAPTAASITTPGAINRVSWASDRRAFNVGDIITVLIDDYTISTAVKENLATDTRTRGLSAAARIPQLAQAAAIESRNAADQTQRGQARRENRFQNEMSVRVVATGPNGLVQVRGTKIIDIDKQKQDIAFTGWVRAQDISVTNVVESSRVADAAITYASPGTLGKPKQGIISKVLGTVWP